MKIRNGFVSNSSSSSFLIISKNNPKIPKDKQEWGDYIKVEVIEENYSRNRNEVVGTLEDKLRMVTSFYAMAYSDWTNFDEELYISKMIKFKNKIEGLGDKYNYRISLTVPPVFFSNDIDFDEEGNVVNQNKISKEVRVSTEWWDGVDIIKGIVEDEDTTRLERLLFNDESFLITGGDEYYKNDVLQYQMKQEMEKHPFKHEFFGTKDEEYFGKWEPYYVNSDRIPEFDSYMYDDYDDDDYKNKYCQRNLPFSYNLDEALKEI